MTEISRLCDIATHNLGSGQELERLKLFVIESNSLVISIAYLAILI